MIASGYGFETRDMAKNFGKTPALVDVSVRAARGQVMGLLGPNGAGKTTLIRILATLVRPDGGHATVAGFDIARQADQVRRRIALCGQLASVDEELSGSGNLTMIGELLGLPRRSARNRAQELLDRFHLQDATERPVSTYSGGMRRRLDLAAAVVGHPEVIFLDEPSVGLDPGIRDELWQMIRGLANDGVTVLLTTQYLEEADSLADSITVIDHGRVIASGSPEELKRQVGGHTAVVRLEDVGCADDAVSLMTRVTKRAPQRSTLREFVVPIDGPDAFLELAAGLRDRGIALNELALRLPSLDEVFLALTGGPAAVSDVDRKDRP